MTTTPEIPKTTPGDPPVEPGIYEARAPRPAPEPHPLGPLRLVIARWPLVLLVVLAFAAAAIAAGLAREPTYTATADVNVGRVDVRVQALPGYVAGATSLAQSYSRIMTSDSVVVPLARRLGLSPAEVRSRLSATPTPDSPMFGISGTGTSPADAIGFTEAATRQMQRYVARSDSGRRSLDAILSAWRRQVRAQTSLRARIARLRALQSVPTTTGSSPAATSKLARLQDDYETAQLKTQALSGQYQDRSAEVASTAGIEVIRRPVAATSDRDRTLQRLIVVGLIAGFLVGAALALLRERGLVRRSVRHLG